MRAELPSGTRTVMKMDKLFLQKDKKPLSERMSSRMVKCASVLNQGEFLGWQTVIPKKGLANISVFGTAGICESDLEWMAEKTAKLSKHAGHVKDEDSFVELYEIYLSVAEDRSSGESIGFGLNGKCGEQGISKWPECYSMQFGELLRVLKGSGGIMRILVGPAEEDEKEICQKKTIQTFDMTTIRVRDYLESPVKVRVLLRLPNAPTARLKAILSEAVSGIRLRFLGAMEDKNAQRQWDYPLENAAVLPDYAARIMMMEPWVNEAVIGMETCDEKAQKIPATHKNAVDEKAITIGRAMDATGIKRKISIGEMDLRRHYQIVGQTGTGKSTLLTTLILSAIERGHGLTFFDPHGTTIDMIIRSLPEKYVDRVRVVRIGDCENPVPLNIWDSDDPVKEERNISDLCELFGDLFNPPGELYTGPRYERWLATFAKASIAFLGHRASLESIAVISQSQDNMLKLSKSIIGKYPELVETIKQEYGTDKSNDFHSTLNWYLCKFQRLTAVEQLRKTLGAGANALNFNKTIDTDTVTLIDLATPTIGTNAESINETMTLMKLWNAALVRKERDRTHLVIMDEAALFQTNPMPRMLAESRKFGISMVLCHQHVGQLTQEVRDALEANSANFSAFRTSPKDAVMAAMRFDDSTLQTALSRLDAYNAITTISVNGRQTAPFTLETEKPKKQKNGEEIAKIIEKRSVEILVDPYREKRALSSSEIQDFLNYPEKLQNSEPSWLREWRIKRGELVKAV